MFSWLRFWYVIWNQSSRLFKIVFIFLLLQQSTARSNCSYLPENLKKNTCFHKWLLLWFSQTSCDEFYTCSKIAWCSILLLNTCTYFCMANDVICTNFYDTRSNCFITKAEENSVPKLLQFLSNKNQRISSFSVNSNQWAWWRLFIALGKQLRFAQAQIWFFAIWLIISFKFSSFAFLKRKETPLLNSKK